MTRFVPVAIALLLIALICVGRAGADGLPVQGIDLSRAGVVADAPMAPRYVTLPAGPDTVVAAVSPVGGQVRRSRLLDGRFTIPAVAYDGSPGGLSADGRTLVVINPRKGFPRRTTTLAVLDTRRLRARDLIALPGDFSFDALSPDGRLLYLVQYLSPRDPTRYLVRLYDVHARRLLPEPIIDPSEVGDVMRGMPVTRASSPDGRWAFTLYDNLGEQPFIHALDTVGRTARCIDLAGLTGFGGLYELRLQPSPDGGALSVVHPRQDAPLAVVDTTTWRVTEPGSPEAQAAPPGRDEDGLPAALVGGAVLGLLLLGLGLRRLRRRRDGETGDVPLEDAPHALPDVEPEAPEPVRTRVLVP